MAAVLMCCSSGPAGGIRTLRKDECPAVAELFDAALGEGYIGQQDIHGLMENPDALVVGSFCGGRLISAATAMLETREQLLESLPADQRGVVDALLPSGAPVGLLKSSAVDLSHRGRGLGTALTTARVDILAARGAGTFLSVGWTDAAGCHAQGHPERAGLRPVADIPDFWREDSLAAGYGCPTCGHPCRCTARVFTLDLRRRQG